MKQYDTDSFSYGAEHEFADWEIHSALPPGCSHNRKDYTIVNSNGVANCPIGSYHFGGEINTKPSDSFSEQVAILKVLVKTLPVNINYRSNLHIHVRVPGLKDDLEGLKQLQRYIHEWMPKLFPVIEPIPIPSAEDYPDPKSMEGAMKRYKRRHRSHQYMVFKTAFERQMEAKTLTEFWRAEVPHTADGRPCWTFAPRAAVNLRSIFQDTETIEFRHFPGTLDSEELMFCLLWCKAFLNKALNYPEDSPFEILERTTFKFPSFRPYFHEIEEGYRLTSPHLVTNKIVRQRNIEEVLGRELDERALYLRWKSKQVNCSGNNIQEANGESVPS